VSASIDVDSVTYANAGDTVELAYVSSDPDYRDTVTAEVGTITGEFYNSIENGLSVQRLDATVVGPNGADQVTWYAEREWYQELQNGEISADELTLRVAETVERV
jgi:hypothetical protein